MEKVERTTPRSPVEMVDDSPEPEANFVRLVPALPMTNVCLREK
ncbi:hypothetical protein [Rhodoblastus sp.]